MKKVGVFGGAFNPPHLGHLTLAQAALDELGLELVLLVPVGVAPHRELEGQVSAEDRLRMCELAAEESESFEVSSLELEKDQVIYTVDTLRELKRRNSDWQLTLLMGADQAVEFASWNRPKEILKLAEVAVANRNGIDRSEIEAKLLGLSGAEGRVKFFSMPRVYVSSTLVRQRLYEGQPISDLVPAEVEIFIEMRGSYVF